MDRRSPKTAQNGFTLIEILISMTLIALVLTGGTSALIFGNKMIGDARDITRVSQVIQSEIEALRTFTFEDLEAEASSSYPTTWSYKKLDLQGQFADKFGDKYNLWRGVRVQDLNSDGVYDQAEVYIWVGWLNPQGNFKWQNYFTRFTRDGLNDYYYRAF